jgi:hypothetical protein
VSRCAGCTRVQTLHASFKAAPAAPRPGLCSMPGASGAGACGLRPVPVAARPAGGRTRPRHREQQCAARNEQEQVHVLAGRAGLRDAEDGQERGPGWVGRGGVASHRPPQGLSRRGRRASLARWSGGGNRLRRTPSMWSICAGMLPSGRGVIGLRQVDGMPHRAPSLRDVPAVVPRHQKGATSLGQGWQRSPWTSTVTSHNDTERSSPRRRTGVHTEEVASTRGRAGLPQRP